MKWRDDLPKTWGDAPDDPPAVEADHAVTMEKRPGGKPGQELREVQTGAWLASSRVSLVADAIETEE
ncbi:hypothetical protein [Haloparvum sedimenti]|uniref:hypothetical protein n=1 Tax=Haloparvum sedimenti TaxID=1678448 RepID=UPI00071E983C|nr:hypothetical protein [Haloparvum sedimenti]